MGLAQVLRGFSSSSEGGWVVQRETMNSELFGSAGEQAGLIRWRKVTHCSFFVISGPGCLTPRDLHKHGINAW